MFSCFPENCADSCRSYSKMKKIKSYIYRLSDELGRGRYSIVYSGINEQKLIPVAIKVIQAEDISIVALKQYFEPQYKILSRLRCPNIIKVHEFIVSNRCCYIISQLCSMNLSDYLKKCKPNLEEGEHFYNLCQQILNALVCLQHNRIIHRDLKPENILVTQNGVVKLCDFGFACQLPENQDYIMSGKSIGTPYFMSPQSLIQNKHGIKSDIWSFGLILYQIIYKSSPFQSCNSTEQLKEIIKEPVKLPFKKISPKLYQILTSCLTKNPSYRLSATELRREFMKFTEQIDQPTQKS